MARLATYVVINDKDGAPVMFGPDDEIPKWAVDRITNPAAWEKEPDREPDFPEGVPSESWKVPQLVAYARAEGIDLGDAKKKDEILDLLLASDSEGDVDDESGAPAAKQ